MNWLFYGFLAFCPLFGLGMFVWIRFSWLKLKWWLFRKPHKVLKVTIFYSNRMYISKYVGVDRDKFDYDGGTYRVNKASIIRKGWNGWVDRGSFSINEQNTLHFEHFRVFQDGRFVDVPDKADLIGELHYLAGVSEPIDYSGDKVVIQGLKNSDDVDKIEKSNVLDQLLTAQFKKNALVIIGLLCAGAFIGVGLLLLMRFEIIKVPLHAVCVNAGG